MRSYFIAIIISVFLVSGPAGASELLAGAGKADITPPLGMPLSGYGNRINEPSTGVHDNVYARALVMESDGVRVGIVGADLLLMTRELKTDVEARVADLDLDFISISATHTHYSVGAYVDNKVAEIAVMGKFDPAAYELVASGLEQSLREAAKDLVPVKVGSAKGDCPQLSKNRRHKGGAYDPYMRVMGVWKTDGDLLAVVMNHAIHPTTVDTHPVVVTGDVAGRAESWLEEQHPGAVAIFMNGGLGDQSPGAPGMKGEWDKVETIGVKMGEVADALLSDIEPDSDVELAHFTRTFDMPDPHMRLSLECWFGLNQLFPVFGKSMMREHGEVSGVMINDALFLFSAGELTYDIQRHLEESFPSKNVLVAVHSNDLYGYVVTPEDYATGGYETCMNFYGSEFGPVLEENFVTMVRDADVVRECPVR